MKVRLFKTILWIVSGIGLSVIFFRLWHGLGSVVALTNMLPWGLWKGGGVVALVPIGGAGFTLAALVYVFRWKRFQPLARGAVLLGLLCYSSVAFGLTLDIGISWRIVFPVVFWQFHSTLFEIAWCIMLYLMVLMFEVSHAILERYHFPRIHSLIEKGTLVFVIAGISLSTLHQSSLGTLFLATPYRLHPLWYTNLLPFLFFITSIGLGCLTISWVTLLVHWLYNREQPMKTISSLGNVSFYFLGFYCLLRFGEIIFSGESRFLFDGTWDSFNFWLEMAISGIIPVILLARKKYRENPTAMFWISLSVIIGISLNRVNVAGLATLTTTESTYFPFLTEWIITFAILSAAGLVYLFVVENFNIYEKITPEVVAETYAIKKIDHTNWRNVFFAQPLANVRLYSAVFILAIGLTLGLLPNRVIYGVTPNETPVSGPKVVEVIKQNETNPMDRKFHIPLHNETPLAESENMQKKMVLLIDADRDNDYVIFDHDQHIEKQGKVNSCILCHHMNLPYEKASSCSDCHRDMYLQINIFDHEHHVQKTGGNNQCLECHQDPSLPKVKKNTKQCTECHKNMRPEGSLVRITDEKKHDVAGGYMDAMHGVCVTCHKNESEKREDLNEDFHRCTICHRDQPSLDDTVWNQKL